MPFITGPLFLHHRPGNDRAVPENAGPEFVVPSVKVENFPTENARPENTGPENERPWLLCPEYCSHVMYVTLHINDKLFSDGFTS